MLVRSQNSRTGMTMETMMIIPPMVGVPFFCSWPSRPRSRMDSPICLICSHLIILLPMKKAMSIAVMLVSIALKDR